MAKMTNNHRYFIQFMLKNGITTITSAQKYCKHISKGEIDSLMHLKTLIIEINREISKQSFKLVYTTCEVTNQNMLVWLNTKSDDISRLQVKYSAIELEYFHAILQEILQNEEHMISFITCINITSTLTSFFSRENGQKMLQSLIKTGYFVNKGPNIYLGPRLILEFTSYLKTHLPDSVCNLCSELVFCGKVCDSCHKTLHSCCLKKYLENQTNCPCCHSTWTSPVEDDIENNMDVSEDLRPQVNSTTNYPQSQPALVSENRRTKSSHKSLQLENETDESEEEYDINQPGPSTRKRHRRSPIV